MIKTTWKEVSNEIKVVNKDFYHLMEPFSELKHPVYIAKYNYGEYFGRKSSVYLPGKKGLYLLGGKETPNEIMRDLGYGKDSLPLAIILDKFCEWTKVDPITKKTYPAAIQGPGTICNKGIIYKTDLTTENSCLSAASGSQSAFILPDIGNNKYHKNIQSEFNIDYPAPKSYHEHSGLFKEMLFNSSSTSDWTSKILYFSEDWINEIANNNECYKIREYFLMDLWVGGMRSNPFSNDDNPFIFSNIANDLKPTPFYVDSSKFIFNIMLGAASGFIPSTNNKYLPLKEIQDIYTNCYRINQTPTVMVPSYLSKNNPVYYSIHHPSTPINSFKGSKSNSKYQELASLGEIINTYHSDFKLGDKSSPLVNGCLSSSFNYYHHKAETLSTKEKEVIIHSSKLLQDQDDRFNFSYDKPLHFHHEAKFFRGCIKIKLIK